MKRESGIMLSEIPFSNIPLIFKASGMDFFILDCEHGGFDYSDISKIIMTAKLCNIKSIIRLADNSRKDIIKFMDMGADGLMLQMTNNKQDIEKVVEYAKYAPLGKRGISTMRAHTLYNSEDLLTYMKKANEHIEIYAQIETIDGVNNVEDILSTEGVAGFLMGPNDLSCEYGCLSDNNSKLILDAIDKCTEIAKKLGKKSGIITGNKNYLAKAKATNNDMFCVGSELNAIKSYCKKTVFEINE